MRRLLALIGIIVALCLVCWLAPKIKLHRNEFRPPLYLSCERTLSETSQMLFIETKRADEAEKAGATRWYCGLIEDKKGVQPVKLSLNWNTGDPLMFQFPRKTTIRLRPCDSGTALEDITKEWMSDYQFPPGGTDGPKEDAPAHKAAAVGESRRVSRWTWVDVQNLEPVVQHYTNADEPLSRAGQDTCGIEPDGTITVEKKLGDRVLLRYTAPGNPLGARCPSGVEFYWTEKDFLRTELSEKR